MWIEIKLIIKKVYHYYVTTHTGGVDWNQSNGTISKINIQVTTHTGGVDWNYTEYTEKTRCYVTTHTCGVDWNPIHDNLKRCFTKSPPTRVVWIEIINGVSMSFGNRSPPTRVVWIEIIPDAVKDLSATSHHPHGWCGLKCKCQQQSKTILKSPPTRVVWIEIYKKMEQI